MRLIKYGIITCCLLLGVGIVGTGVSLGKMYESQELIKQVNLQETLKTDALKNIYITSDVPLKIETTKGAPYVTFSAESIGVSMPQRTYDLDVEEQGQNTYIEIKESKTFVDLTFQDYKKEAVIYLPEQVINKLQITTTNHLGYIAFEGEMDINELVLDVAHCDIALQGKYNQIDIKNRYGSIDITSYTPAKVSVQTDLRNNPVYLSGQYKDIVVERGSITVDSTTPYNILVKDSEGDINLNGNLETAKIQSLNGSININSSSVPKRIQVNSQGSDVNIQLPEDTPGFEVLYTRNYLYDQGYEALENTIYSNFDVKTENIKDDMKKITYGDGSLDMLLNMTEGDLYILK